jgi:hypothetical protein
MEANLQGRLKKCRLSPRHGLWPVFEAVINSLQAIEARKNLDGSIGVHVARDASQAIIPGAEIARPITGFQVTDNGIGFNAANLKSFETYDSEYKAAEGGKGVGRLLWLVAFDEAKIESTYTDGENHWFRSFDFNVAANGIEPLKHEEVKAKTVSTTVRLVGFKPTFRDGTAALAADLAEALLEHCLPYFFHRQCPVITLTDDDSPEKFVLNDLYRETVGKERTTKDFAVGPHKFEINHLRMRGKAAKEHALHLCAHKRSVVRKKLSKEIPNLGAKLPSENGNSEWNYVGYVFGNYLDQTANAERTNFDFPKEEGLLSDDVTESTFINSAIGEAEKELETHLVKNRTDIKERVTKVIEHEMPDARAVLRKIDTFVKAISPNDSPKALRRRINEAKFAHEMDVKDSVDELIEKCENTDQAKVAAEAILAEVTETSKSKLLGYVAFRKAVLEIYRKQVGLQPDGKFSREDAVHDLIFPRKGTSDRVSFDDRNLWIIDDRLAFHHLLSSDLPLSEIKSIVVAPEGEKKRPDLLIVNRPAAFSNTDEVSSVVIVELKRPQRNDFGADENPISQVFEYIENIRHGKAYRPDGVALDIKRDTPFFIYIVADATPTLKKQIQQANIFTPTADPGGSFGYAKDYNAYIEICSFEKLIRDADKRNYVWFKHLGIA